MAHRARSAGRLIAALTAASIAAGAATEVGAVDPNEVLADPVLEQRARDISQGLRCVVCQNQSIDDSDAELARDLRVLVRERITAGDSDSAVVDYVVSRYGDFVLMKPPFKAGTYLLWIGPLVAVAGGAAALFVFYRRGRRHADIAGVPPLSAEEERRLRSLLPDEHR